MNEAGTEKKEKGGERERESTVYSCDLTGKLAESRSLKGQSLPPRLKEGRKGGGMGNGIFSSRFNAQDKSPGCYSASPNF